MKQEYINVRHTSIEKKNFIINHIVTKSHVKAYKDTKNMTKRSSDEKKSASLLSKKKIISSIQLLILN